MCGICGIVSHRPIDIRARLNEMNSHLVHRGPDDEGYFIQDDVGLAMRRLSIIDLESGHQPMLSKDGKIAIVFNGEIYNYKEIRELYLQEYEFETKSDTEVLLHLYHKFGRNCLDLLNGMFAFAIYDSRDAELFIARDRLGIKPFYYCVFEGIFAFSSEIKALLTLPWVRAALDEEALYYFLTFNKVASPLTMFKGIMKLHPGYMMTVNNRGIKRHEPYWEVEYKDYALLSELEISRRLADELERAVKDWMVSDVPVGAFLSGGVDSSAVVAMMRRVSPAASIRTYSVGFKDAPAYNELHHAREISMLFKTDHYEKIVSQEEITEFLPKIVDIYDEPLSDATSIPLYFISEAARKDGTRVVMTGDGGDELFCGYRSWLRYLHLYPLYRFASKVPFRPSLFRYMKKLFRESSPIYEILNRAMCGHEFFWGGAGGFKEGAKRHFLSTEYAARLSSHNSHNLIRTFHDLYEAVPKAGRKESYVDWMCFLGVKDILPNHYLYRADRMGMAHSVEIRTPMLDHHFVNLALSIPGELKIRGGEPKYILKRALEPFLPKEILYRKKQGFCVPLREWGGEIMADYIDENVGSFCRSTGLFDKGRLLAEVNALRYGRRDGVFMLWNIYFLMSWFRRWIL
ncbi:MAG: asparagine synthase (glutamine-hydrolyzing) [Nitrospirae bacterium]|nr:asparagine synthase (glutamine-hydrolyzing) [Nitrospirota bacterium]